MNRRGFLAALLGLPAALKRLPSVTWPGYTAPPSSLADISHIYYKKRALANLQKKFVFTEVSARDAFEPVGGRTVSFYRLPVSKVPEVEKEDT